MSENAQQNNTPAVEATTLSPAADSPAVMGASPATESPVSPAAAQAPVAQVLTRVHKLDSISERSFWFGHIIFTVLALAGLVFILWARGPRRRDAILSSASEGKE